MAKSIILLLLELKKTSIYSVFISGSSSLVERIVAND